jgi:signal transduction histidine kinase
VRAAVRELTEEYSLALGEFLARGGEEGLLRAYELGRRALAEGFGVLEMAALHQEALLKALLEALAPEEGKRLAKSASEFFLESVAPFEMTQRGIQEVNSVLRELNATLEQRIQAAQEQLEERRRIEKLKDEFISIVSHELRTPLTSIHASLGLIRSGFAGGVPDEARELLEVAHRNSQRLVRLVSDILDLQKVESGTLSSDLQAVEVAPLLQQAVDANQAYAAQLGVTLALDGDVPEAAVWADADLLMQVMTNLLSNAAKFSPRNEAVLVRAERRDGMVRVSVTDRGPGIPEHFHERIFQRFAQADASTTREKGGTGLGLSITKAIVEQLGGRIAFETRAGAGTTFHFELPEWRAPLQAG